MANEKWTPEERSAAESYVLGCQTGGKRPITLLEVEIACQRNELISTLETIKGHLNADDPDNYRADDSEGAMDTAYELSRAVLEKCK